MSEYVEEALELEDDDSHKDRASDQNNSDAGNHSREWETMARAWVLSFPAARAISMEEVEAWIDSNIGSLPQNLVSMPRSDLCQRLISIQNLMRHPTQEKEEDQNCLPHARFQRTDQWMPVYSWLESLNQDDAVNSKEISDWLTENPTVRNHLCSRHSRYHLMHYIKKCHLKILKRRERKKGLDQSDFPSSLKVQKDVVMKQSVPYPRDTLSNLPKDSEMYMEKQKEAFQKYEILVELEKLLSPAISKSQPTYR